MCIVNDQYTLRNINLLTGNDLDFNHSSRESVVQGSVAPNIHWQNKNASPGFQFGEIQHMHIKYLNYKKE